VRLCAKLVAAGLKLAPAAPLGRFHLVLPTTDGDRRWHARPWKCNRRLYRRLTAGPVPRRDGDWFTRHTNRLIRDGELMA